MALIIGSGDGPRIDVYEYDLGWSVSDAPSFSVLVDSVQHGYIYQNNDQWSYSTDNSEIRSQFDSLIDLLASIDPNASVDLPDDLLEHWED